MSTSSDTARRWPWLFLSFSVASLCYLLFPSEASAIPAWTRQYGAPCATCHYPAPPRLNAYGHKFRRAQYRLPGEFGKDPEWEKVGNYLSFRIRGRYEYSSTEDPAPATGTTESSSFKLNDATLFYAGPVTKHFSGFVELERPGDSAEIEAVVSVGGIRGTPDSFWTFRLGQFHTLTRVGWGGMDRPTGITTPDALSRDLTSGQAGFSSGTAFKLNQDQVGVEGTYVHKNWRIIGQVLNGVSTAGATTDQADENKAKDGVLAYELMWGETASGLTAFAYRGVQDDPSVIGSAEDRLFLKRLGVTAAQVWKNGFEVQGGYVRARDDFDADSATQETIDGVGAWVEAEQYFEKAKDLTIFGRWDLTDPNTDIGKNKRAKVTAGLAWPVSGWHAKWALELRHVKQETATEDLDANEISAELMLNF